MFYLSALLCMSVLLYSSTQDLDLADLNIVSDLLPEDCFEAGQKYDDTNKLPRCANFTGDEPGCPRYHRDHNNSLNYPTCTKSGDFDAKQCKGQRTTGRCFCFDYEGSRIFGQQWWYDAINMTCACSRRKADMNTWKDPLYFNSLHCNSVGNFEQLQCDVVSGQCWCADEKTGELTSSVVPQKALSFLPCYDSAKVGAGYLRQCESTKYAQNRILHQLKLHGTDKVTFGELLCDDDGSYGAYEVIGSVSYCTWRDRSKIQSFQGDFNSISDLDCNCARDYQIFSDEKKTFTATCTGYGNYQTLQRVRNVTYCVDRDGYVKSPDNAVVTDEHNCTSYPSYNKK